MLGDDNRASVSVFCLAFSLIIYNFAGAKRQLTTDCCEGCLPVRAVLRLYPYNLMQVMLP